ncbi:MAG: hypothetical protein FJ225_11510, partial [Lentisphaerae bacterium]|nr:hypothetical protein [Lentisphaerota bacterium]
QLRMTSFVASFVASFVEPAMREPLATPTKLATKRVKRLILAPFGYERSLARLREWMKANGLVAVGEPVWARYNPPFTPWFLRRNEILLPIESAGQIDGQAK